MGDGPESEGNTLTLLCIGFGWSEGTAVVSARRAETLPSPLIRRVGDPEVKTACEVDEHEVDLLELAPTLVSALKAETLP